MLEVCEPQEKLVLRFGGSMDTAACAEIETEVRAVVAGPDKPVVFDLNGVNFVSSAFLRLCIYACQQAPVHGFQIVNVAPPIKRVFKIAGLDVMLAG